MKHSGMVTELSLRTCGPNPWTMQFGSTLKKDGWNRHRTVTQFEWTRSTAMDAAGVLANCHVWGCPVFVLAPKLHKSGVKIPKWNPRSRQDVNVGFSRLRSSLIAIVWNTTTKTINYPVSHYLSWCLHHYPS
jgi:hypothetical protein